MKADFNITNSCILKILLSINLIGLIWNIINDCDETFNYWEPLYHLIHGSGFQTWEYSPEYGLRSYLYLYICGWPAIIMNAIFKIDGRILFYSVRLYFVLISTFAEYFLFKSLEKEIKDKYTSVYCIAILIFSTGSFIATSAFLPSSFAFICSIVAFAGWIQRRFDWVIASVGLSAILGWPFSVVIGVPMAIDIVFVQGKYVDFVKKTFFVGTFLIISSVLVDSYFYGSWLFPSANIVHYNVFNSHGPELYGVESAMYYVKNYILNFNIACGMALILPLFVLFDILSAWIKPTQYQSDPALRLEIVALVTLGLWNTVFFLQPHKEERFLFPCYSALALCGGLALSRLQRQLMRISTCLRGCSFVFLAVFCCLSVSRVAALVAAHSAPMSIYGHLSDISIPASKGSAVLCVGREWHRFPSHFFVPRDSWRMEFVRSAFRGQLPAKFALSPEATRLRHGHFNDLNLEQVSRYVSVADCDFVIDHDGFSVGSNDEVDWEKRQIAFRKLLTWKMLDPRAVGGKSTFFRSFYVPILFDRFNHFVNYTLYEQIK